MKFFGTTRRQHIINGVALLLVLVFIAPCLLPILGPVAESLGMDPIHFAILIAANVGIGMISPPVGICLYVACGISGSTIEEVTPRLVPFLVVLFAMLVLITLFPSITLFLPRLLGYA